jgi:SLT domain-containing protein
MNTESGGNALAVNRWDSNWFAGHPSVGLMQVIAGTFRAFAGPFRNTGPFEYGVSVNPLANIYAGLNYAIHRYGTAWTSVLGQGHGYDRGGFLRPGWNLAYNGTGRPEPVGWNMTGGGGMTVVINVPESSNPAEVGRILASKLAAFKKQGGYIYRPAGF